ncbi:MAG TPA: hypothetical protein VFV08_09325 [Puia sp.]|nr:hypothetical protein [Puia sp.]
MAVSKLKNSRKSIDLSDYDFAVDKTRQKMILEDPYDGCVTIRLPGKNRKTANHELVLIPFMRKHNLKFQQVAIGQNKKKSKDFIMVFDNERLGLYNAQIRKYGNPPTPGFINSKGHTEKLMKIFNIALPKRTNEVIKVYFSLTPIIVNKKKQDYSACSIVFLKKISSLDQPKKARKRKYQKKKPAKKETKNNIL